MAAQLPPEIASQIEKHLPNLTPQQKKDMCWLHERGGGSQWLMKHEWVERLGAAAGIQITAINWHVVDAQGKHAMCQVVAEDRGGRVAITTGESAPYNSKISYPFAMAEKRGVDRAILKLIGIHGTVYSEEEMEPAPRRGGELVMDLFGDPDTDAPAEAHPFDEWWDLYAYKVGSKAKCEKKWNRFSPKLRDTIMQHTRQYVSATRRKDDPKDDRPERAYPETYLNGKRWESEELVVPGAKSSGKTMTWEEMHADSVRYKMTPVVDYVRLEDKDERGRPLWRKK